MRIMAIALAAVAALSPARAEGQPVPGGALTSTSQERSDLAVTVYNINLALVKEVRSLALPAGRAEVRFKDVASQIDPRTVHMASTTAPAGLELLEQNYEYDLISPDKLMERFVGRKVTLIFAPTGPGGQERQAEGTLVSTNGGMVYEIDGRIHVNPPARVVLPEIPGGLISVPTLVWLLSNSGPATHKIETSYLTGGVTWSADYVSVVSADDSRTDLTGWVTIDNTSGATWRDARLKLVAGDVHRAGPEADTEMLRMQEMAARAAKPAFAEEAFFEYHLYTLDRPTTIKDRQTKQIALLEAAGVPVKKIFLLAGQPGYFRSAMGDMMTEQRVAVNLELVNSQKNGLGMPLPQGIVRLYQKDSSGSLQFIGEDRIRHTPRDERITLRVGEAFDVVAERRQTDYRAISGGRYDVESEFEIRIRNHKDGPITVLVREPVHGDWKVLSSSHPPVKLDAGTIEFSVPVAAGGEAILRYRVAIDWS